MTELKPSGLRPPSKIGRPCSTMPPRPAIPPSSPRPASSESLTKLYIISFYSMCFYNVVQCPQCNSFLDVTDMTCKYFMLIDTKCRHYIYSLSHG